MGNYLEHDPWNLFLKIHEQLLLWTFKERLREKSPSKTKLRLGSSKFFWSQVLCWTPRDSTLASKRGETILSATTTDQLDAS